MSSVWPRSFGSRTVLLRLDLNVPLRNGRIVDDYKIQAALPTVQKLSSSPVIILTHLGEPTVQGEYEATDELSLAPIARRLANLTGRPVRLASGSWDELEAYAATLRPGDIMLLENLRFWKGETANSRSFARHLARLGEAYVNDAFAVSHRRHASVAAIKNYLPSYAGPELRLEFAKLTRVKRGRRPLVVVMGGAKISSKLPLIKRFLPGASQVLVGGALANDLLRARGVSIGASYHEKGKPAAGSSVRSKKIILPEDAIVVDTRGDRKRQPRICRIKDVAAHEAIVDIGPETCRIFSEILSGAQTIIWNGPMGTFEKSFARKGTKAIVVALVAARQRGAAIAAGGGETVEAIALFRKTDSIDWELTGGGASLAFLSGENLPGLAGLLE